MEHEASFLSAFLGLAFVLGIIFLITYLFKRFGPPLITAATGTGKKTALFYWTQSPSIRKTGWF